jgi:hypothetical protein
MSPGFLKSGGLMVFDLSRHIELPAGLAATPVCGHIARDRQ